MTTRSPSHQWDSKEQLSSELPVQDDENSFSRASQRWYQSSNKFVRGGFLFLNLWLVFHLFAIFICPASMEPSSRLLVSCFERVAPYLHFLYLDHGFHYFAPDPGASTLVEYTLEFEDGNIRTRRFPNRTIWPRLLYHRHFMLSEFLGNCPPEARPMIERSFARNLCRESGAVRVSLTMITHETPTSDEVKKGMTLSDESLFKRTPLGKYTVEELRQPYVPKTRESVESTTQENGSPELTGNSP